MPQLIKIKFLCVLVFVLLGAVCEGQQILQKAIQAGTSSGMDILVTNDGYLIYGSNNVLVKVNTDGNQLWAYRYYSGFINDNIGNTRMQLLIEQNGDTSIVMTGTGRLGNIFLMKTDMAGNLVWGLNLIDSLGLLLGVGRDITINNQMIYLTGRNRFNNQIDHGFVCCVNTNGNIVWFRNYLFSTHTTFNSIHINANKLYLLGSNYNGVYSGLMMCTDLQGNVLFAKEMQGFNDDYFTDMVINSIGELTIIGNTKSYNSISSNTLILKTDSLGTMQWCKVFDLPLLGLSIIQFNENLLINTHSHPNILICDTTAQIIKAYYTGNNISYGMLSSRLTPDSGFVSIASIDIASSHHMYLYKSDRYGSTACNSWSYNIVTYPWQPPYNSIVPFSVTNNNVWSDTSYVRMNAVINNVQTLCSSSTGIEDEIGLSKPEVYPNPFTSELNIHIPGAGTAMCDVLWTNITGQLVTFAKETMKGGRLQLKTNHLPEGTYFIKVQYNDSAFAIFKLIKIL